MSSQWSTVDAQGRRPAAGASVRSGNAPLGVLLVVAVVALSALVLSGLPRGFALGWTVPFVVQVVAWSVVFWLLARREDNGIPRISDPGVMVLLWAAAYLVLPSFLWLRGWQLPLATDLSADRAVHLMWLHTLYISSFGCAYLWLRGRSRSGREGMARRALPGGWMLFLVPAGVVVAAAGFRWLTTGSPLPTQTYGSAWFDLQASLQAARSGGGLTFIIAQLDSRLAIYIPLIQGIGAGLLLVNARLDRRGLGRKALVVAATLVLMAVLSTQPRSSILVVALIAVVFADLIGPPIRWRYVFVIVALGLFLFVFLQYFRAVGGETFGNRIATAYHGLAAGAGSGPLSEFTSMFGKEAAALTIFPPGSYDGIQHLIAGLSAPLPSQILPPSLQTTSTAVVISAHFLDPRFTTAGAGVAGSAIGDGIRTWGTMGVALVGAVFGAVYGALRRWSLRPPKLGEPTLFRLAVCSGIFSWAVIVIRADLTNLVLLLVYYIAIPWVLAKLFATSGRRSALLLTPADLGPGLRVPAGWRSAAIPDQVPGSSEA